MKQNDSSATTGESVPESEQAGFSDNSWFSVIRNFSVKREAGWLGGVAAGIASRIGIDALIVRGIFLVLAFLGFPIAFFYALAWLFLADRQGRIYAQSGFNQTNLGALWGMIILVIFSFTAFSGGIWWAASSAKYQIFTNPVQLLWNIFFLIAAVVFIIVARNSTVAATPAGAQGFSDFYPENPTNNFGAENKSSYTSSTGSTTWVSAPEEANLAGSGFGSVSPAPAESLNSEPQTNPQPAAASLISEPQPPKAADRSEVQTPEEIAAWQEQHRIWQESHNQWRQQQQYLQNQQRAAAAHRAQQQREHRNAIKRQRYLENRARNPKLKISAYILTLGLALLVSGLVTLVSEENRFVLGGFAAIAVVAVAMIVAGLFRRKASGLNFWAVLFLIATLTVAIIPIRSNSVAPWEQFDVSSELGKSHYQTVGYTRIDLMDYPTSASASIGDVVESNNGVFSFEQGIGAIKVYLPDTLTVEIDYVQGAGDSPQIYQFSNHGKTSFMNLRNLPASDSEQRIPENWQGGKFKIGPGSEPQLSLELKQGVGAFTVYIYPSNYFDSEYVPNTTQVEPEVSEADYEQLKEQIKQEILNGDYDDNFSQRFLSQLPEYQLENLKESFREELYQEIAEEIREKLIGKLNE